MDEARQFLVPQSPSRTRSFSDTSLRTPIWDTVPMMQQGTHQGSTSGADGSSSRSHDARNQSQPGGTVNMNDVLPDPSSSPMLSQMSMRHPASAGAHQTSFGGNSGPGGAMSISHSMSYGGGQSDFLSPDIGATNLRRVKSEGMRGHRQVRSEDLRYSPGMVQAGMYPPPSSSTQEFIRATVGNAPRQFLHPTEAVTSITRGHHRRSSSGSRERGSIGGWSSGASSARASPYPSPSASPRPGYGTLPPGNSLPDMQLASMGHPGSQGLQMEMSMGMGMGMSNMGGGGLNVVMSHLSSGGGPASVAGTDRVPMNIAKVNVTTPSTADASQKRRKQPAHFLCPVPGCGSTFTRHFNLKGRHLLKCNKNDDERY